jgi:integrase
VLDSVGMRVSELEHLTWGDVDEQDERWRVRASAAKTRHARWVPVPAEIFQAVVALTPREDPDLDGYVFAGFGADRYRTALTRACKAAGVPAFSPNSRTEHLPTYTHVTLTDRREINYLMHLELERMVA